MKTNNRPIVKALLAGVELDVELGRFIGCITERFFVTDCFQVFVHGVEGRGIRRRDGDSRLTIKLLPAARKGDVAGDAEKGGVE
jgi:hypothetical protein